MQKKYLFMLIAIMALGAFLRFYRIKEIPLGLYPDEAMNGNNALEAIATGQFRVFYPENNGREGLFINLQAISLAALGNAPWTLRIVSAIIGTLTILGIYLAAKELFGRKSELPRDFPREVRLPSKEIIALLSAFFLATSYWHLNFSRIGFRAIMLPLAACFGAYFLLKGLRRRRISDLVLAGLTVGLGLHTYIASRFMTPVFAVPLVWRFWHDKKSRISRDAGVEKEQKYAFARSPWIVGLSVLTGIIAALPLMVYFAQHPHELTNRAGEISVFAAASPIKAFAKSTALTIAMFFWRGDCNWRHNFNCAPALHPLTAIFFLIGIVTLLKSDFNRVIKVLVSVWLLFLMLPATLTREGIPHALRTIGMIPPVMILAGLGADRLWRAIAEWTENQELKWPRYAGQLGRIRRELLALFILILLVIPLATWRAYFLRWADHPKTYEAFDTRWWHLGEYLASLPHETKKYVAVNTLGVKVRGIPMPAQTVMFATDTFRDSEREKKNFTYLTGENITDAVAIPAGQKTIIAFMDGGDRGIIRNLQKKYPELRIKVPGDFVILQNY